MQYKIHSNAWGAVFAVPTTIVDKHIKLAGAVQLKVILWALRRGGDPFSPEDAAKALHFSVGDITDAIQYWVSAGVLLSDDPVEQPVSPTVPDAYFGQPPEPAKKDVPAVPAVRRTVKPTGTILAERINQSEEIAFLMQQAQEILGRTISPALSSTLLAAHDDYGLPVEVLVMLLMYVKSIGKTGTQYIDAVARGWAEEEIFTHDIADKKLHQLSELTKAWRKIETAIGMDHRSPSAREEQYTDRWMFQWKFSAEMVREAYERCVDATGKMTFSYMNKILERWHKNGITTVEQAKEESAQRSAKRAEQSGSERTYDINLFDQIDFTTEISSDK